MLRSRAWANAWAALRLLAAAAGVAAIVGQLVRTQTVAEQCYQGNKQTPLSPKHCWQN